MTHSPKTAYISGAGRNIGRAIALHLAGQGVNIVVNGSSDRAALEAVATEAEAGRAAVLTMLLHGLLGLHYTDHAL